MENNKDKHIVIYVGDMGNIETRQIMDCMDNKNISYSILIIKGEWPEGVDYLPTIIGFHNDEIERKIKGFKEKRLKNLIIWYKLRS